jgi:hypothetical protein
MLGIRALSIGRAITVILLALFTLEIAGVSILRYFVDQSEAPQFVLENRFSNPFLALHVIGGVTALMLGPIQLIARVRDRMPQIHRMNGRIYALACAIGAPAGFMLAIGTQAGKFAAVGFAIPAILWPIFTILGVHFAIERDFDRHRVWMLRSYAITANAITLRLMLPAAGILGLPFMASYSVIAWLGWIVNLVIVEIYLRRRSTVAPLMGTLQAA